MLILRTTRTAQPQQPTEVDARFGIHEAWLPHVSPVGLVRKSHPSVEAAYNVRRFLFGSGLNVTATGRRYAIPFFNSQSTYAWLMVAHRDGSGSSTYSVLRKDGVATPVQEANAAVRAIVWPGGTLRQANYNTPGGENFANYQNKTVVFAGRVDSSAALVWTLMDGVITEASIPSGTGTLANGSNPLCFGANELAGEVATPWSNLLTLQWQGTVPSVSTLHALMRDRWSVFSPEPRRIWVPGAVGGGISQAIGQATEADTAQALTVLAGQSVAIAQAVETDAARPLVAAQARTILRATETDAAQALRAAQARGIGRASETDTAQPFTTPGTQIVPIGLALEIDAAGLLAASQSRAIGRTLEADAAQALRVAVSVPIGAAAETDAARALQAVFGVALAIGRAAEVDEARSVGVSGGATTLAPVSASPVGRQLQDGRRPLQHMARRPANTQSRNR